MTHCRTSMLTRLYIRNYILIDELDIRLAGGLTIVTGETGAGKSILLGALGLLTGQRADSSTPADSSRKCIVEGTFDLTALTLKEFFAENDLEYDTETIIRREILPDGRSRAFVNDSPVNLTILKELGTRLIDIHSQHQQIYLTQPSFQMQVTDSFAGQLEEVETFRNACRDYRKQCAEYDACLEACRTRQAERDYLEFQYKQLVDAHLQEGEQQALEEEAEMLSHAEDIKQALNDLQDSLSQSEQPLLDRLRQAGHTAARIAPYLPAATDYAGRLEQAYIDLKDLAEDIARQNERTEYRPERLAAIEERLQLLYTLQQKHRVGNTEALIALRDTLAGQLGDLSSADERLQSWQTELQATQQQLMETARRLSAARRQAVPDIERSVDAMLQASGIPNGKFRIQLTEDDTLHDNGINGIRFLFAANKSQVPEDLSKVASGGELSRIMLSIKAVIAEKMALPTLIFDEIDTGISGGIADRMGNIMADMARRVQIINITHLPQIAAKGRHHFSVYKRDEGNVTRTYIKELSREERVEAIARMLSGTQVSEAATANARILLGDASSA
ncbi:MAG: DNA repair protein RecN [Bacteroidales bacterium]|nr:DNA repair protein RecN [Bacteroidales bacterium]